MYSRHALLLDIFSYFKKFGFSKTSHTSLISKSFPDTFNPSGGHDKVSNLITSNQPIINYHREVFVDICFRHIDIPRIGFGRYASLFEMLTFIDASYIENKDKATLLKICHGLITDVLKIKNKELFFTTFGGWNDSNKTFDVDEETIKILISLGIEEKNIWVIPGPTNFVYTTNDRDAAGPRVEIFVKNDFFPVPLEIGTIVFEEHYFKNKKLIDSINRVYGGAFGVERMLMAINKKNINDIDPNYKFIRALYKITSTSSNYFHPVFFEEIGKAVDYVKALTFISSENEKYSLPSRHGPGQRTKKLIKLLDRSAESLGLEKLILIDNILPLIFDSYHNTYPDIFKSVNECKKNIRKIINEESV